MKKLLLSASMLLTVSFAFAQSSNSLAPVKEGKLDLTLNAPTSVVVNTDKVNDNFRNKKAVVQDWYQPLNFLTQFQGGESPLGSVIKRYVYFVSADSNFKVVRADDNFSRASFQSYGQILDPKDALIENTENPFIRLSTFNPYTLDSIFFQYSYIRNTDSTDNDNDGVKEEVIDTVYVAYFAGANITTGYLNNTAKDKISYVKWNGTSLMPTSLVKIDTFLLGNNRTNSPIDTTSVNADQTSFGSKFAQLAAPTGMNINKGSLVGFTATFKSGTKAVVNGDTAVIINQGTKTPTRWANTFGTVIFVNEKESGVEYTNPTYFNSSQVQPQWNAYGTSASWAGSYIPGLAFESKFFIQSGFHLTCANVGVAENDLVSISAIYPNPANGSTTVGFNLKQAGNVSISVSNLLGQTVATLNPGKLASGNNTVNLNVSNIKAGVYFVNVSVDGVSSTKKLTITE